jgi:hypothetical protein
LSSTACTVGSSSTTYTRFAALPLTVGSFALDPQYP